MTNSLHGLRAAVIFIIVLPLAGSLHAQWQNMDEPNAGSVFTITEDGPALFATNPDAVYRSDNDGADWYTITENIPKGTVFTGTQVIGNTIMVKGYNASAYLGNTDQLYISRNNGQDWKDIPLPVAETYYPGFLLLSDKVLFSASGFIWELPFSDWKWRPAVLNQAAGSYYGFKRIKNKIYAYGWTHIAESSDEGETWNLWNTSGIAAGTSEGLWANGDTMLVSRYIINNGNYVSKTFRTFNKGQSWSTVMNFNSVPIINVVEYKGVLLATSSVRLMSSVNKGINWQEVPDAPYPDYDGLVSLEHGLFVIDNGALVRTKTIVNPVWQRIQKGIKGATSTAFYANDTLLLTGAGSGGLHRWNKNTGTWSEQSILPSLRQVSVVTATENRLLAGILYGNLDSCFYFSDDNGATWSTAAVTGDFEFYADVNRFCCTHQRCYAYRNENFGGMTYWYTEDNGANWKEVDVSGYQIEVYEGYFYSIAPGSHHLQISTDGLSWFPLTSVGIGATEDISAFYPLDHTIYLWTRVSGTQLMKLYYSDDDGFTWTYVYTKTGFSFETPQIWGSDALLFSKDKQGMLIYSTDKGVNWYLLPPVEQSVQLLGKDDQYMYAAAWSPHGQLLQMPLSDRHYRQVKITAFHDQNSNGQKEPGEPVLPGILLRAPAAGYLVATDTAGTATFTLHIAPGTTDTVYAGSVQSFQLVPAVPAIAVKETDTEIFAAFITTGTKDLGVFMGQTRPLLAGHTSEAILTAKNTGGQAFSGVAKMSLLPPGLPGGIHPFPAPDEQSGDTLIWNLPALAPDSVFVVKIKFLSPENPAWNDHFLFKAKLVTAQPDEVAHNNSAVLDMTAVWQENPYWIFANQSEISVSAAASGVSGLTYCSGFENLYAQGQPVKTVQFFNPFPDNLNIPSLRIIASSHPVQLLTPANGLITLQLNTQQLPDTTAGDAGRCYVLFRIDPVPQVAEGDLIGHFSMARFNVNNVYGGEQNRAITRIVDQTDMVIPPPPVAVAALTVSPNPTGGDIRIDTHGRDFGPADLTIIDTAGKVRYQALWNGGPVRADLPSGLYFVRLTGKNGAGQGQVIYH